LIDLLITFGAFYRKKRYRTRGGAIPVR
jgi:hypothetical protein